MGNIGMKKSDLAELYTLLEMYGRTYGEKEPVKILLEETKRLYEEARGTGAIGNSRGAGRKGKYPEETKRKILELRKEGSSIRKIAEETGCSTGYVQKLINEHMHKEAEPGK
ncbi:MAG: helix-turn-helix domain-containing protein [Blautia sp.]